MKMIENILKSVNVSKIMYNKSYLYNYFNKYFQFIH